MESAPSGGGGRSAFSTAAPGPPWGGPSGGGAGGPRAAQPMFVVPVDAVLEADGSRGTVFVLSADGKRAERRAVTIGFLDGDRVAVVAGLAGVRSVVTDGAAYLDDGAAVRVRP